MTKLEALKKVLPKYYSDPDYIVSIHCPCSFGLPDMDACEDCDSNEKCEECWNRDILNEPVLDDNIFANTYQALALSTMNPDVSMIDQLTEGLMGLAGESGEAIDILKKYKFQGHDLDRESIALELGDVAWYLATAANAIGYPLSEIFCMNVLKLQKRYPNGFSTEDSIKRVDEEESNG